VTKAFYASFKLFRCILSAITRFIFIRRHTPLSRLLTLVCLGLTLSVPAQAYLDAGAAYRMALRYHHPLGQNARNHQRAMLLYCRADTDGHGASAHAIGLLYAAGHGVKRNNKMAAAWFRRAIALGHTEAKRMLTLYGHRGRRLASKCPNGWGRGGARKAIKTAPKDIKAIVRNLAPKYRLDPDLVMAVIAVESAFQENAISSANAQGLMQLIPATASRFGVRDPFNPRDNIQGGMAYLRWLLNKYKGNVTFAFITLARARSSAIKASRPTKRRRTTCESCASSM
jgi:soluble lytic murein transglycosylase-like protein